MKLRHIFVLILVTVANLTVFAQSSNTEPHQITSSLGSILRVELSPDGLHVAVMTIDQQGETAIETWNTTDTTVQKRLVPDLTLFNDFIWSPNSQYIAVTGSRTNASGYEYSLLIYDIFDEDVASDVLYPRPGRDFREFIPREDTGERPDYASQWSSDGSIIAINFRDGIYFYDITACDRDECRLLNTLDIGYVAWFDWQGDSLITLDGNVVQVWDVSDMSP